MGLCEDGRAVVGMQSEVHKLDLETGALELIATAPDLDHTLVVAAHRPEPVLPELDAVMRALRDAATPIARIELGPLDLPAITAWLSRILMCSPARAKPLARAVLRGETRGYRQHPQLLRFSGHARPVPAIDARTRIGLRGAGVASGERHARSR